MQFSNFKQTRIELYRIFFFFRGLETKNTKRKKSRQKKSLTEGERETGVSNLGSLEWRVNLVMSPPESRACSRSTDPFEESKNGRMG